MPKEFLTIALAMMLFVSASSAEPPKPDYGRSGWYLGLGGGAAFNFLDGAVGDFTSGVVDLTPGGSFNARGGYRLNSWFALEFMYEGNYGQGDDVGGVQLATFSSHSLLANFKFIAPTGRLQPYIIVGAGAQYGDFNDRGLPTLPGVGNLDTTRWDFVLRVPIGVDAYVTENWLLNLELAPSVRFADYRNVPSQTTDNVTLTVSLGAQYRF